jgi:Rps23 Pro-64 3,4-dihydroxylase Tpa1-like proline 4-hydroxylase
VDEFLPEGAAETLFEELVAREPEFLARGADSRGPKLYRLPVSIGPPPEFVRRFRTLVPALERRFGTLLERADVELVAQAYPHGGSFGRHRDAAAGGPNWKRRLSGVYYLHRRPPQFQGGNLVLYDRSGFAHAVEPDHNTAVFFSRDALHEVQPVSCPSEAFADFRFALNIWIS